MQPCIYCRRLDVARTEEHVLQEALGATKVLPHEVCGDCNAAFSRLDKDFIDAVEFVHLGRNVRRRLGVGLAVHDGVALRTRLRNDGLAEHPSQFYESAPGTWQFLGTNEDALRVMLAELAEPRTLRVKAKVCPADSARPVLSIMRSAPRTYLVEGTNEPRVTAFLDEVSTRGLRVDRMGLPSAREIEGHGPPIKHDLQLDFRRMGRAMAKVALNFVGYRLGADVALSPTFDALRAFARHDEGDLWAFVKPALLTGGDTKLATMLTTGKEHALVLLRAMQDAGPREVVFVIIAGRYVGMVNLQPEGAPAGGLADGTWLISRCDPDDHRWDDMRIPDDAPRAFVNPAALGLEAEWSVFRRAGWSHG
jgi:hypothetical protein